MTDLHDDLHLLSAAASDDVQAVYDRVAPSYDRFRERWLAIAGSAAEQAMLADIGALLEPGARVLDAGCGTGALSREMLIRCPAIDLTMLDLSDEMLARTADLPGTRLQGSVLDLPFADGSFDVVVSAWVIETVTDPLAAVTEHGFAGEFLDEQHTPWHHCESSHRRRFRGGLTTEIALRKCCTVGPGALPSSAKWSTESRSIAASALGVGGA